MTPLAIALILIALVGGAVVGFFAGQAHRKKVAEATIGSANQEATRIINQALTTALAPVSLTFLKPVSLYHSSSLDH